MKFHHTVNPILYFLRGKCHPEILTSLNERGRKTVDGGKNKPFSSFKRQYLENDETLSKLLLMNN